MNRFFAFIADVKSVLSWIVKFAALSPFLGILVNLGPIWPSEAGAATISSVTAAIVFMLSYEFLCSQSTPRQKKISKWVLVLSVLLLIGTSCAYFYLASKYVVEMPDAAHRVVTGSEYNPDVKKLVESDPTMHTPIELLKGANGQPEMIWTRESIAFNNRMLLTWWVMAWASFLLALSAFVTLRTPSRPRARR